MNKCAFLWLFAVAANAAEPATSYSFDFTKIPPDAVYSKDAGYGFDLGTKPSKIAWGGTGGAPFFFSVMLPEGNYRVTAHLGDSAAGCVTTIKAESRRLMVERAASAAGERQTITFAVNIRNFKIPPPPTNAPGGDQVRLNDREQGVLRWDDKLTLEFNSRPRVDGLDIVKADEIPTVFLAGDSTVTDQPREPTTSWGQMLTAFFNPGVAITNHAESGETLKSFITGLRLDKILSQMKKGDYLFIQFGHNDQKENWPQTYVEPFTTHKAYLKVLIAEARRRGAFPVLVTPMQRRNFDGLKIRNTLGDFPESVRQTAKEENVPLIDLTKMSIDFYEALGPERAKLAFSGGTDATHHSAYGAHELAKCIVEGIRANKLDLARYILADYKPFDPAHPDSPGVRCAGEPVWQWKGRGCDTEGKLMNRIVFLISVIGLALAGPALAEVRPSALFGDHAVLQSGMSVPVWGIADPGEKVTVAVAGQTQSATAGLRR
jgi:lysophospholipase L1-like esterase